MYASTVCRWIQPYARSWNSRARTSPNAAQQAVEATRTREYFSAFNESPSPRVYGEDAAAEGKAAFHALARNADGVLDNLRGDQPEKLGLTYGALKEVNPRIVCAHSDYLEVVDGSSLPKPGL